MISEIHSLKLGIETQHGGVATFKESVPIKETYGGITVWEGIVNVFDLVGHPKAKIAYAWSSPIEGSSKRRVFAALHVPPITGPQDALRAAIVAEYRAKNKS